MVAGDLVNTASRVQSDAEPGTVLVGEATRRATEAAIAYEDAGTHDLKGKAEPVQLCRALRVIAGRGGALRSRPRAAVRRARPRAPPRQGALPRLGGRAAGAARLGDRRSPGSASRASPGSSRSTSTALPTRSVAPWPLPLLRRRGRYWALAEMVRMRCGIAEDEDAAPALAKLRATLEEHVADPEERLGRAPPRPPARPRGAASPATRRTCSPPGGSSSSGWPRSTRSCSCSRTSSGPTPGCSTSSTTCSTGRASHPIFVVSLARPELAERHAAWGAGEARRPRSTSSRFRAGDGGAARRARPRPPDELRSADPRPRRGHPALRRRDGADAARPRPARPRRRPLPPTGPIESLDVPRRSTPWSPRGSTGSPPRSGGSSRMHPSSGRRSPSRGRGRLGQAGAGGRALLSRSCARRCSRSRPIPARPSAASTPSSRTSSSTSPTRRCRSGSGRRSTWPLRSTWRPCGRRGRGRGRRGRRCALSRRLAGGARRRRCGRDQGNGARHADPRRRTCLLARRERRGAGRLERAIELTDDAVARGGAPRTGRVEAVAGARADAAIGHYGGAHRALRERRARPSGGARHRPARPRPMWERGTSTRHWSASSVPSRFSRRTSRTRTLAALAAELGRLHVLHGRAGRRRARIETALELAEALRLPEVFSEALNTGSAIMLGADDPAAAGDRPGEPRARARPRAGEASGGPARLQQPLRPPRAERPARGRRSGALGRPRLARKARQPRVAAARRARSYSAFSIGPWDEALELAAPSSPTCSSPRPGSV